MGSSSEFPGVPSQPRSSKVDEGLGVLRRRQTWTNAKKELSCFQRAFLSEQSGLRLRCLSWKGCGRPNVQAPPKEGAMGDAGPMGFGGLIFTTTRFSYLHLHAPCPSFSHSKV